MLEVPRADDGRGLWHSVSSWPKDSGSKAAPGAAPAMDDAGHIAIDTARANAIAIVPRWAASGRDATTCASAAATSP